MKQVIYMMATISILFALLTTAHLDECQKHVCKPCKHGKDYYKFYDLVSSRDSGFLILETGVVTFKPFYEKEVQVRD